MEVTRFTAPESLQKFQKSLETAVFVAVDTEFTGIAQSKDSCSLSDTPAERYSLLKQTAEKFSLCQIGLAVFQYKQATNEYTTEVFNLYVVPGSLCSDGCFSMQSSAVDFLSRNKFDFNKCFFKGIRFMNEPQLKQAMEKLIAGENNFNDIDGNQLEEIQRQVVQWISQPAEETLEMDFHETGLRKMISCYLIQKAFPTVLVSLNGTETALVTLNRSANAEMTAENSNALLMLISKEFSICTEFLHRLSVAKVPLIGHNLSLDLLFLFHQLLEPLPSDYGAFKSRVHEYFPTVFDTKPIALGLKEALVERGLKSFGIGEIYDFLFKNEFGKYFKPCQPSAVLHTNSCVYDNSSRLHEAGYDAFITGAVFIRLAHITATLDKKSTEIEAVPIAGLFEAVAAHRNKVHLSRAAVPFLVLDGPDPMSQRPEKLIATSRWFRSLNQMSLVKWLSTYGSVDVQPFTRRSALIAVANPIGAREILKNGNQPEFTVEIFKPWWHGRTANRVFWIATAAASVLLLTMLPLKLNRRGRS